MNRTELPEPRCELEDRVVAAFLDGEPDLDASMLAAHLDECAACAEAVRQSRELESLLAAQTRTDIDDAVADRLLAGIDAAATEPVASSAPTVRWLQWGGRAAAAAVLVAALGAVWVFARGRSGDAPEPDRRPVREAAAPTESRVVATPREVAPSVARAAVTGFVLPGPAPRTRPARKPVADEDVLRQLEGQAKLVLDRRVLTARATVWLTPPARTDESEPAAVADPRRAAAATRWLFAEIRRGWLPPDRALLPARQLLASRGRLRRELVMVARSHEDVLARLVRSRSYRGRPDGEAAALIGAVGSPALLPAVRDLNAHELGACVAEARRTGDTRCLSFLVDLYLDGAARRSDIRWSGAEWLRPTLATAGESLADLIRQRAEMTRNRTRIVLGDELLVRLGLAETCLIARAAARRERRG